MPDSDSILVAAQISSLFHATHTINIPTKRTDIPLPPTSDSEHATYSELFYTEATGTVLLRLLHDGQIIELISLSTDTPPIRFVFPAAIVPCPALVWGSHELHVIAVTNIGSLFRVIVPIADGASLWHPLSRLSTREHAIQKLNGKTVEGLVVHVQGLYTVVLAAQDGSLLRLEVEQLGQGDEQDQWSEHVFHHGSFLNSLATFLQPPTPGGSSIIAIASHPQPTDIGHVWTLSRDRTIRLWTAGAGCVFEKTFTPTYSGRAGPSSSIPLANGSKFSGLLHGTPQRLLRVFTPPWSDKPHVMAFIPTESSPVSGGYFSLSASSGDHLQLVQEFECSSNSAHAHLQDFIVTDEWLYTLWDKQGQCIVEKIPLVHSADELAWQCVAYPPESELTPAYLDELLLSPGSLADKFFEAIMRPGMFSPWTLQTAISQYTDACLSIPGHPPPQLLISYPTTAENIAAVVGCTVQLTRDPHTGIPLYDNYWNALKRDWEGFVARCREIERSARWPLAIGLGDPKGDVLVVERERIGCVVGEDLPLRFHRMLSQPRFEPADAQMALLDIAWTLRAKLGPRVMLSSEMRLVDIVRQEIAFPYADIIQDTAQRLDLRSHIDEGFESWLLGRLESVGNLETTARFVLDIIGGFDKDVKREEEEVELLLPSVNEELSRALTAGYATYTVNARYDFALALVTLLFFVPDIVPQWDPSVLAEIFVVFRGIALLRYTSRQPAGPGTPQQDVASDDEMINKLRNMNVSASRARHELSFSLLHRLLTQFGTPGGLPTAAHHFLDATGLLQSLSPAVTTKYEVTFGEQLRLLGYREAAREVSTWLPRTPAMSYVLMRVWLDENRYEDAAAILESLAGSFGPDIVYTYDDRETLASVLPGSELFESQLGFYLHAAGLFRFLGVTTYDVLFSQLAIATAPADIDTSYLWQIVIKGLTDSGLYDDAYAALMSSPYETLKRECVSQLAYKMCEEHAVDRLMSYNFTGVEDEVEDALSFKARNADPQARPFYSRILYTWYVSRGDYRNAASTMYQRARKLAHLGNIHPEQFIRLAELQLEALVVSMNALSLLDPKSAWFVLPVSTESGNEQRKRRKLSKHIPESKYTVGTRDIEVVEIADIQHEYTLLAAQLELVRNEHRLLASRDLLLTPPSVILKLAQSNKFEMAITTARSLDVDMTELFAHLTVQCLRIARNPDSVLGEDTSDWLLTDKVSSWPGTAADRSWRYLRQALERHDGASTSFAYSKVTFETALSFDRSSPPPPWLIHLLEENHPEFLIRTYLRYEVLESALEHALSLIRKDGRRLAQEQPTATSSTWLPYTLIDQVLVVAESQDKPSPQLQILRSELRTEIASRLKRVQKLAAS